MNKLVSVYTTLVLLLVCTSGMAEIVGENCLIVTDDFLKEIGDSFAWSGWTTPAVQFFAFTRDDWDVGSRHMKETCVNYPWIVFFAAYDCEDRPLDCPSDLTLTTYRFYADGQLALKKAGTLLDQEAIDDILKDFL